MVARSLQTRRRHAPTQAGGVRDRCSSELECRRRENIAPAHIEACLGEHDGVAESAVVGPSHSDLGEEVGAIVRLCAGATTTDSELETYVRSRLAHFEVPSRWWIRDEELPKTDTGKILKRLLVEEWMKELR